MEKLKLYLDLNEIENNENYIKIGKFLSENKSKKLYVFTKKGIFLDYFKKYLNEDMTGEDFVMLGDVFSVDSIKYNGLTYEIFFRIYNDITQLSQIYENSVFIFDQKAFLHFKNKFADFFAFIENHFKQNNSEYFVI